MADTSTAALSDPAQRTPLSPAYLELVLNLSLLLLQQQNVHVYTVAYWGGGGDTRCHELQRFLLCLAAFYSLVRICHNLFVI